MREGFTTVNPKVGRLQVAAESPRVPTFWSSFARQEVGDGKGVDNLFPAQ